MRLHRCARCRRHIRLDESRCPFCDCETIARTTVTALTLGGVLTGCPDGAAHDSGGDETTSASSTASSSITTTMDASPSATVTLDSGDDVDDESTWDDGWDTCVGFYGGCPPDGGGTRLECDIWAQDCPEGEKCMPWANDGGGSWNATRCSPLDPSPRRVGEPCTVEGSGVSGIDDCELGSMCWGVDAETNQGVCVAFCDGNLSSPICKDPTTECLVANDGVLILCLPSCDPLLGGCGEAEGCYPNESGGFFCVPDASGDNGEHGDPCDYLNDCDPGLLCVAPERVFDCFGVGCCTEACDLEAEDPNAACSGFANGEVCTAYFAPGQPPPDLDHLGVCIVPEA